MSSGASASTLSNVVYENKESYFASPFMSGNNIHVPTPPRKRCKSDEVVNNTSELNSLEIRNIKRRKAESPNKDCMTQEQLRKTLCQRETAVQLNPIGLEVSSALVMPNSEKNSDEMLNSSVPNNNENLVIASTSTMDSGLKEQSEINRNTLDKNDRNRESNCDMFEEELKCSICSEIFISAVTLNCSHSFCKYCIMRWRNGNTTCPMCRQQITVQTATLVLDRCVEKLLESSSEETKKHRKALIEFRDKDSSDVSCNNNPVVAPQPNFPAIGGATVTVYDSSSEDDDLDLDVYDDSDILEDSYDDGVEDYSLEGDDVYYEFDDGEGEYEHDDDCDDGDVNEGEDVYDEGGDVHDDVDGDLQDDGDVYDLHEDGDVYDGGDIHDDGDAYEGDVQDDGADAQDDWADIQDDGADVQNDWADIHDAGPDLHNDTVDLPDEGLDLHDNEDVYYGDNDYLDADAIYDNGDLYDEGDIYDEGDSYDDGVAYGYDAYDYVYD